jgi:serine/threonine-protein kinase
VWSADDDVLERCRQRVGSTLCRKWHIDRLIGVGGMAAVYAATHRNGNQVAIKILHHERSLNPAIRKRFLNEGYAANKVRHRGAVAVLDDEITEDGTPFLVMELLAGETLQARLEAHAGNMPPAEMLALMDQVLGLLEAAHDHGVVHRDLKPENILVTNEGKIKVLDFGIAGVREEATPKTATSAETSMGTPAFMPPEQARGRWDDVDAKSDQWAIGATMFTMLTGRHVHQADTVNEHMLAAMTEPAPKLATVLASVPQCVAELVDRALSFDKSARFESTAAMHEAVRQAYLTVVGEALPEYEIGAACELPVLEVSPRSVRPTLEQLRMMESAAAAPQVAEPPMPASAGTHPRVSSTTDGTMTERTPSLAPATTSRRGIRWVAAGLGAAIAVVLALVATRSTNGVGDEAKVAAQPTPSRVDHGHSAASAATVEVATGENSAPVRSADAVASATIAESQGPDSAQAMTSARATTSAATRAPSARPAMSNPAPTAGKTADPLGPERTWQ